MVNVTPQLLYAKNLIPIIHQAGWVPELLWTDAENLAPLGFELRTVSPINTTWY
jgi:hypothetical protein